jgi:hypothetical protein
LNQAGGDNVNFDKYITINNRKMGTEVQNSQNNLNKIEASIISPR